MTFISPYCGYCRSQPCICMPLNPPTNSSESVYTKLQLEAAVLAEREACAKLCDKYAEESSNPMNFAENCAAAIRARGE